MVPETSFFSTRIELFILWAAAMSGATVFKTIVIKNQYTFLNILLKKFDIISLINNREKFISIVINIDIFII